MRDLMKNGPEIGVTILLIVVVILIWFVGFAAGTKQIKNCTNNNQCLIPEPKEGFEIKIDKKRDGEVYVWGDEN